MADISNYFVEKDNKLYFNGNYMEVYIPEFYFEKEIATLLTDKVKTLGIFNFKVFSSEQNKDKADLHIFKFPSFIETKPSSFEKETLKLSKDFDEDSYRILKYYKNDEFIVNLNIVKSTDTTKFFIELLHAGKLPKSIPYNEIVDLELASSFINGSNLGVPSTVIELIASEICRDKNDLSKPFRFKAGSKNKVSLYDYKPINIKTISTVTSTFTAVTFEDINYNLVTSINKTRYNETETESPIEKTIKY